MQLPRICGKSGVSNVIYRVTTNTFKTILDKIKFDICDQRKAQKYKNFKLLIVILNYFIKSSKTNS